MTTQTVHLHTYDYGASLSGATLRVVSTDVLVATADSVNEVTADSGLYAAVFGETAVIAAGEYRLRAIVSGKPINRYVTLAGTDGEVVEARSERLAVLDSDAQAMVTAFNAMRFGNVFTEAALTNAPGGDATLANQTTIIGLINAYLSSITAVAQATPGTIAGFPATLSIGDSYTDDMNNAITVTLVDDEDNPVDTWGDYDVNHAGFTPTLVISGSGGKVTATVTYDTDHFLVEIPSSESLRASPGTATMQFVLKWYVDDRLVAQKTIVTGQAVTWIKQI